jgi:methyl-accepting chemotaxis protein
MSLMDLFNKMSIRSKLIAAFLVILTLFGALGVTAMTRFATLNGTVTQITSNYLLAIDYLDQMRTSVLSYRFAVARYVVAREPNPKLDALLDKHLANYRDYDAKYGPTVETGQETTLYQAINQALKDWQNDLQPVLALYRAGKFDEAARLYISSDVSTRGDAVDAALAADMEFNSGFAARLSDQAAVDYSGGQRIVIGLLVTAVLLAVGIGWALFHNIAKPLTRASEVLAQLARREYGFVLRQRHRGDEVGALSRAIDALRQALQAADAAATAQAAEQVAKAERATRLDGLAHDFEAKATQMAEVLASAATQLHTTALGMSSGAERTSHRASMVSAAAGETSANVQSVAASAEELVASVGENWSPGDAVCQRSAAGDGRGQAHRYDGPRTC